MNDDVQRATEALTAMYDDWETNGGVSPDTADENLAIARALNLEPLDRADTRLETIYELGNLGALPAAVAAAHVDLLRASR